MTALAITLEADAPDVTVGDALAALHESLPSSAALPFAAPLSGRVETHRHGLHVTITPEPFDLILALERRRHAAAESAAAAVAAVDLARSMGAPVEVIDALHASAARLGIRAAAFDELTAYAVAVEEGR